MNAKRIVLSGVSLAAIVFSVAAILNASPADRRDHTALVIRNIGHQLLLRSGDSVSRVLPVRQGEENSYLLEFQRVFSFSPDTVVMLVRETLAEGGITDAVAVSVLDCSTRTVVYGFELNRSNTGVIPCLGRLQPEGCYRLQIKFLPEEHAVAIPVFYFLTAAGLCGFAFIGGSYFNKGTKTPAEPGGDFTEIGQYRWYASARLLKNDRESIELSEKETELLGILSRSKNELVTREQLLKEVWEDQGVFTGRSLDMFISKLRKKLKNDPNVQVVNVHGRGYKLIINYKL